MVLLEHALRFVHAAHAQQDDAAGGVQRRQGTAGAIAGIVGMQLARRKPASRLAIGSVAGSVAGLAAATVWASSMLRSLVNGDGRRTPVTRSGPRASTAIAALSAESIPPETPSTIAGKLFFFT